MESEEDMRLGKPLLKANFKNSSEDLESSKYGELTSEKKEK